MLTSSGDRASAWIDENLHPFGGIVLAGGVSATYLALFAWAWQNTSYDVWGALLVAPALVALTVPVVRRMAHAEGDRTMVRLVMGALLVKLVMTLLRYVIAFGVYGGQADASSYHRVGTELARLYRTGVFQGGDASSGGTATIEVLTGIVYTAIGPTQLGGFIVFSWLGFWGLYLLYRAFRVAVPDGDHRRYALLVFFLPSMTFWPSSIGKEAWMTLMLGLTAYGLARTLVHVRGGFALMAAGLGGATLVRPHVALIFSAGLAVAFVLRTKPLHGRLGALPKVLGVIVIAGTGVLLLARVEAFFEPAGLSEEQTAMEILTIAENRTTDRGGSAFDATRPTSPTAFVQAVITVLFRPFPQEANNLQAVLAAAEGLVVAGLCVLAAPRALFLVRSPRQAAYGWLALVYTLLFCYAFASIGNFGILTRQRTQVLPFLLVLLCLPLTPRPGRSRHEHRTVAV